MSLFQFQCSTPAVHAIEVAIDHWQAVESETGSGPQGKPLLTLGCLSGYLMHIAFLCIFYETKMAMVEKHCFKVYNETNIYSFKLVAVSFISRLLVSFTDSLHTSTEQVVILSVLNQSNGSLMLSTQGCLFFHIMSPLQQVATNIPLTVFRWSKLKLMDLLQLRPRRYTHPSCSHL